MSEILIESGVVHDLPGVLEEVLLSNTALLNLWNSLTPLARNEWICYITMPKKPETKTKRLQRLIQDISNCKKRPCCWPGCPHRRESAKKWFT